MAIQKSNVQKRKKVPQKKKRKSPSLLERDGRERSGAFLLPKTLQIILPKCSGQPLRVKSFTITTKVTVGW